MGHFNTRLQFWGPNVIFSRLLLGLLWESKTPKFGFNWFPQVFLFRHPFPCGHMVKSDPLGSSFRTLNLGPFLVKITWFFTSRVFLYYSFSKIWVPYHGTYSVVTILVQKTWKKGYRSSKSTKNWQILRVFL